MDDMSDRDRLALAFDDLAQANYLAPIDLAWTTCCNRCGLTAINEMAQIGNLMEPRGYVFWHIQKDEDCFYPEAHAPMPATVVDLMDADALDPTDAMAVEQWTTAHAALIQAALMDERMTKYNKVLRPLNLNWGGDPEFICEALSLRGLHVHPPENPERCIKVLPVE